MTWQAWKKYVASPVTLAALIMAVIQLTVLLNIWDPTNEQLAGISLVVSIVLGTGVYTQVTPAAKGTKGF